MINYNDIKGIIHVGANSGQERDAYALHDLDVIWFEPNPEVFSELQKNIVGYPKQKAYCLLVLDVDDKIVPFHISSHRTDPNQIGQSSSIFELGAHKDVWPDVYYSRSVMATSITLDTFMERSGYNPSNYTKLHIDVQGAELLVLKGATKLLDHIRIVQAEVSSLELYKGGALESDVDDFLGIQGFRKTNRGVFIDTPAGTVSENIYER